MPVNVKGMQNGPSVEDAMAPVKPPNPIVLQIVLKVVFVQRVGFGITEMFAYRGANVRNEELPNITLIYF